MIQDELNNISHQLLSYWLSHNVCKTFHIFKSFILISKAIQELNSTAEIYSIEYRDGKLKSKP